MSDKSCSCSEGGADKYDYLLLAMSDLEDVLSREAVDTCSSQSWQSPFHTDTGIGKREPTTGMCATAEPFAALLAAVVPPVNFSSVSASSQAEFKPQAIRSVYGSKSGSHVSGALHMDHPRAPNQRAQLKNHREQCLAASNTHAQVKVDDAARSRTPKAGTFVDCKRVRST